MDLLVLLLLPILIRKRGTRLRIEINVADPKRGRAARTVHFFSADSSIETSSPCILPPPLIVSCSMLVHWAPTLSLSRYS